MKVKHDSMRGWFGASMYDAMENNEKIYFLTADLGWGLLNDMRDSFPERFKNVGASEQCAVGAGVGLALSGRIPFVYSITTFLIFRAWEWHRNYLNHENIPVRLIGSGFGSDYAHDGITHQPHEIKKAMKLFPNIKTYFPNDKTEIPDIVKEMVETDRPSFLCLRR